MAALAREESGSAARSLLGGYVEWDAHAPDDACVRQLAPEDHWDLVDVIAIVSEAAKSVSSLGGHERAHTSPLLPARIAALDAALAQTRDAIARRDFGATADPGLGTQTVNLLTNLDTTGGNSGSPVMDARGRLVGLNFDSNWEAVSASWKFDPRYKRAIHVDARYMRWIMARVYPAPRLLREMGLPLDGADRAPPAAAGR